MCCYACEDFSLGIRKRKLILLIKSYRKGDVADYSMIELQGELETKSQDALGGKIIGDLHFNHDVIDKVITLFGIISFKKFYFEKGNPVFIIGHHILHGKAVDLEKPMVVITKEENGEDAGFSNSDVKYTVTAVIKHKYIFKTRPKPIVGKPTLKM